MFPELRQKASKAYEFWEYEVEEMQFGSFDERPNVGKDYAFIKLKEWVGAMDERGRKNRSQC